MYSNWGCFLYITLLVVAIIGINILLRIFKIKITHRFVLIISSCFVLLELVKIFYQLFGPAHALKNPSIWVPLYICSFSFICAFIYSLTYKRFIGRCFLGAYLALGFILSLAQFVAPDDMCDMFFTKAFTHNFDNLFFSIYSFIYHTTWAILFFIIFINLRVILSIKKYYWQGGVTATCLVLVPFIITNIAHFGFKITNGNYDWCWFFKSPTGAMDKIFTIMGNDSGLVVLSIYLVTIWGMLILLILLRVKLQNKYPTAFQ